MDTKLDQIIDLLNKELGLMLSISFGVFLFVLFFQPFPLDRFDFNNKLVFVAGLCGIIFLSMFLVRVAFHWLFQGYDPATHNRVLPSYAGSFILLLLSSVSFPFYLHYVGNVTITFLVMFEVVLICMSPPVIIWLYDLVKELKQQNAALIIENKLIHKQVESYEDDYLNQFIEFISENNTEKLSFPVTAVAFIRSADNYVEIVYKERENFKKKLIRNTLKNIEQQLKPYSNFVRCHRICIVNMLFIEKLQRNYNNHLLRIRGYDEQIPVSRQYLLRLKETL
jgi:DNA-binding LytR/AlgR family response regulator